MKFNTIKIINKLEIKEDRIIIKMIIIMETNTISVIDKTITTNNNTSIMAINNFDKAKNIKNKTRVIQLSTC